MSGSQNGDAIKAEQIPDPLIAQSQFYDAMVKATLEGLNEDVGAQGDASFASVRKWQENLERLLEEQSSRPPYEVGTYTTAILEKLEPKAKLVANFDELVTGEPQWNVSRLFVSALILTNNGNIEIEKESAVPGQDDSRGFFNVKLLDSLKSLSYAIETEEVAALPPPAIIVSPSRRDAKKRRQNSPDSASESDSSDWAIKTFKSKTRK